MRSRKLKIAGIFLLIALGAFAGYRLLPVPGTKAEEPRRSRTQVFPVRIQKVSPGDIEYRLTATGDILALMQVDLHPRVSGYLQSVPVQIGMRVAQGQVIAVVDQAEITQKVREAEAVLAKARAQMAEVRAGARPEELAQAEESWRQTKSRLENARINLERVRSLVRNGYVARQELDNAQLAYELAEAQSVAATNQLELVRKGARAEVREAMEAQVKQAEATLNQQRLQLENTVVRAPFSGNISRRFVDPGALVSTSTPLVTVVHSDTVKVLVNILEKDLPLIKVGAAIFVRTDAYPDKVFQGQVVRLNSAFETASRTLVAEAHIQNPGGALKPGMFARVEVLLARKSAVLRVPTDALLRDEERKATFLYVVNGDKVSRRPVTTGLSQDSATEVVSGLKEGEAVVTVGHQRLRDGASVQVIQ
ncbi:MAG: efflux RND transporter periplasmic adaptor subunit [Candidatus Tectomicrobia bacterium]|uniref:Efflux RND transporter periplasmic adaptor subunit n=1 Tax=Tectimicrobiota bacterium TaxID=2528274 RepID=A0A932GLY3_UNCTE|nr:efflux RND transporter periplasmic adaptor subunit [Candidatus Tectomicrobia bacterium]